MQDASTANWRWVADSATHHELEWSHRVPPARAMSLNSAGNGARHVPVRRWRCHAGTHDGGPVAMMRCTPGAASSAA